MAKDIEINVKANTKGAQVAFDQIGNTVKKLNPELSKLAVTTEGKLSPALQTVSRRDLGLFASQMLYSSGVAGRMTGQLSNLATGLLTGGIIGGAFAGFAAIINGLTERIKEHNAALDALDNKTMDAAERTKILKKEMQELADPGFWETFRLSILANFTGLSNMLTTTQAQMDKISKGYYGSLLMSPDRSYIGSRQSQISTLRYQQSKEQTLSGAQSYNERILQLQNEIDVALGKQNEELKRAYDYYQDILDAIREIDESMLILGNVEIGKGKPGTGRFDRIWSKKPDFFKNEPMLDQAMKQREQDMAQFSQQSAGIFAMNMNQAWESIFGEANSMFEQMLSAWQGMLFEKIGFGIFNMLFGGIDLFGFARNLVGGQSTAAKYGMGR